MKKVKRLVASGGKYTAADGSEKTRWIPVGTMFKRDDGNLAIKIDAVPVGEFNGWVSLFDFDDERKSAPAPAPKPAPVDDDLPF